LRTFGLSLPFGRAFHFTAIGTLWNLVLLGSVGGDAVRMFYAWRSLRQGAGRIAIATLTDRILGVFALLSIAAGMTLLMWRQLQAVPSLALLAHSVLLVFVAAIVGALTFVTAPMLVRKLRLHLSYWPRLARLVGQIYDVVMMARENPIRLLAAFMLSLVVQGCTLTAFLIVAETLDIGSLGPGDYLFAAPLTLIANALPLTPNGLGVGEVAFDQICRWLEPQSSGAAYSSIFFAYRALAVLISLTGLVSFVLCRIPFRRESV
jgi:hypothetical protein